MELIIPRLLKPPKQSFFLFGPRGTGKTTWLKFCFKDALFIDLLAPDIFRLYSAKPERLSEFVFGNPEKKIIIIDEVQKVPELLTVVHTLIEANKDLQFILTGSSSRKLRRTGVDLLAGRAIKQMLFPFMAVELKEKFSLSKALDLGLIPLIINSSESREVLKTYIALYIREEVQMEGLVRNIGNFSRFLEAISFSHASIINISNVARECQVERKVVEAYIGILEDLLLSFRIPVFSKRAKRKVVTHPKFYYFDSGVYRSLRPSGPLDEPEEIQGSVLEGLVAQHLLAWNGYRGEKNKLYFWRTVKGLEVDFVMYGEEVFWAIEVKNTAKIRNNDLKALKEFKKDYPESEVFLLYRGKERLKINDIQCIPCEDFLKQLDPEIKNIK